MVLKRSFSDEESYELSCKHPRQLEYVNQMASFIDIFPSNYHSQRPDTSVCEGEGEGEVEQGFSKSQNDELDASHAAFSRFFESDSPIRVLVQSEGIYSYLLDCPPRKLVSIGPDHQADIPVWDPHNIDTSDLITNGGNRNEFMGTCIIPMPYVGLSSYNGDKIVEGRTDCNCPDGGSVRCVRHHIMEAREKLRETLGQEKFMELGFFDMGEEVRQKWSEEEEQVFHEVVFSNPSSSGKNFWDHLSMVFPSRTMKDLVCYYFNVFMLRRRGEQNRSYPLNIDSDNDVWQESDDEAGITEEDEDSPVYNRDYNGADSDDDDDEDDGDITGKTVENSGEDQDAQDDSCTSYECQANGADFCGLDQVGTGREGSRVVSDPSKHHQGIGLGYDGLSNGADQGHILEPSDAKVWDFGYFFDSKKDVDFLPTCNMIEEVFGRGSWNNNGSNDKSIS